MMHIIEDLRHNRRIPCLWSQFEPLLQNIMCLIAHLTNTVKYVIIVRKVYLVTDLLSGSWSVAVARLTVGVLNSQIVIYVYFRGQKSNIIICMYVSVESNMCFNSTHFLSFERSLYIYPHSFTVQYWTVLYCTVLRRTVLCTTVPGRTRSCSGRRSCPRRSRRSSTARTPGCTSCSLKNLNSIKKTAKRGLVWLTL